MIFVTVGTGKFEKLVRLADELSKEIKEKVIIQKGNSNYNVKNARCFKFTSKFDKYIKKARIIVSHGGAGTIFDLLNKNKKIIALANFDRIDKHQKEILEQLNNEGHLIYCRDFDLENAIKKSKKFKFKKYKKPDFWIDKEIIKLIG